METVASVEKRATIVAVFNPKGGVGKTTVATSLAASLQLNHGQRVLLVDADTVTGQDAAWTTTTAYAIVSVIRSSLGGTLSTPEFVAQTDFASNGIRDASRLTEEQAALLVSESLTEDDSPLAFAPESPNAINGMQLLAVTERTETTAALTIAHPTADNRLLLNDLGFINVDGQLFKVAAFAVLRGEGTIASLQAFGKSVRDAILGAN